MLVTILCRNLRPVQEKLACDVSEIGGRAEDDDDDDVIMTQEEVGVKCPYTQQVMKDPVRNNICGHNYEKTAIQEFILRKKGKATYVRLFIFNVFW